MGIILIPNAYGSETIDFSEYQSNNQTVTYVDVTIENSIQGSAMITSAIILGFVGFSSAVEFTRFTRDRYDQRKMILVISIIIIIILLVQFVIIITAYLDVLDKILYPILMIITLILFMLLLAFLNIQSRWYTQQEEREHTQKARFHKILDETSKHPVQ